MPMLQGQPKKKKKKKKKKKEKGLPSTSFNNDQFIFMANVDLPKSKPISPIPVTWIICKQTWNISFHLWTFHYLFLQDICFLKKDSFFLKKPQYHYHNFKSSNISLIFLHM